MIPNPFNLRQSVGVAQVWDAETGKVTASFAEHTGLVNSLAFSPDGRHVASAGLDKDHSFAVWDSDTGKRILTYPLKNHGITMV